MGGKNNEKILIAIIVFVVVMAFTVPIFADPSTAQGQRIKDLAQNDNGTGLSDWIKDKKDQPDISGGLLTGTYTWDNHGQFMQLWKAKWGFKDLKE